MQALPRIIRPASALGAVGYDPDAQAYFNAMSVQPDATRKGLINDFIVGLKADGVWSLLDLVYILASHDAQAARLNAKAPASNTITTVGTVTFTADRGYTGDGSTGYLNPNRILDTAGNYTQNSGSLFSWVNSSTGTTQTVGTFMGTRAVILPDTTTGFIARVTQSADSTFGNPANRLGSRCASRTGSTTVNAQVNGVASGSTSTVASSSLGSAAFRLLGDGAGSFNGLDRLALATTGGGLTGTQMTALHNRSSTFLTAIGAN